MKHFLTVCAILLLWAGPAAVCAQQPLAIDAQALIVWLDTPDPPLILDVRGHRAYRAGSLPGAFDTGSDPMGYLPERSDAPVVLFIDENPQPHVIESWTVRLRDAGHPVWVLTGGMAAWSGAGGAIEIPETGYAQPGRTPFLIPRGLCEGGEPAQVFE